MVSLARVVPDFHTLIRMPKKVSEVEGPSTLNGLIGTSSLLHSASIALRFCLHMLELPEPAVKKSSR